MLNLSKCLCGIRSKLSFNCLNSKGLLLKTSQPFIFRQPSINKTSVSSNLNPNVWKKSFSNVQKVETDPKYVGYWFLGCSGMVFVAVALGGITRLTESGLSMVNWKLLGEKLPTTQVQWEEEFNKYQQYPEFKMKNSTMTIEEFKWIWWMEYAHRTWGRCIGAAFFIPMVGFLLTNKFSRTTKIHSMICSVLLAGQGLMGWYMVKSGLEDRFDKPTDVPRVSQYRLASHLCLAFILYSFLLTNSLRILLPVKIKGVVTKKFVGLAMAAKGIVFLTAMSGAFVAGLDAGLVYNSFPKMGDKWIPDDILQIKPVINNITENPTTVQFNHRVLGISTVSILSALYIMSRKSKLPPRAKTAAAALVIFSWCQKAGTKKSGKKSKAKNTKKSKNLHLNINKPPPSPPPPPPSQGQFICIHVGQAGVQVGSACWELFCAEHGINPDGTVHQLATDSISIFSLLQTDVYVPRALFVDSEPSIIDAIKNGNYNKLFPPQNMIYGKENAANNHAAGYYGVDRKITSTVMDQLAHLAEDCNSLQGIALFRSVGGGTGSGMGSRIIENIKTMYPNKTIIDFNIYTSEMAPIILEPYNVALATHHALDTVNCSLLFDNRSLYDICYSKLNLSKPTYKNINSIIALVLSGFTSSLRFSGSMIGTISELLKNLIPQPRLHFPIVSYAPIVNNINSTLLASIQLATMSFDYSNQMIKIDPGLGKYLSVCMMFQGDLKPTDINMTIAYIQREQLIPVSQNMSVPLFKFGLCNQSLATIPGSGIDVATRAVTTLCNNTSVKHCWISIMKNYNKLLTKRAFLHHYIGEGMDEMEFCLINENISKLIVEYREIENSQ